MGYESRKRKQIGDGKPVKVEYSAHGLPKVASAPGAFQKDGEWDEGGAPHESSSGMIAYLRGKRDQRWFSPKNAAEIIRNSPHAEMFGEATLRNWEDPQWNNAGWDWVYVYCSTSAGESVKRATEWAWKEVAPLRPGLKGKRLSDTCDLLLTMGVSEPARG